MAETPRTPMMQPDAGDRSERGSGTHDHGVLTVFLAFLRLGLTSFGGPVAHLAYFRDEFVTRRRWMSERAYADLVGLCQFLPGPASSQVGLSLGLSRAGYAGALAAWVGFTLPSALAMILFAQGLSAWGTGVPPGLLHGLKLVAVAVVAQAFWGMARSLCPDALRVTIMAIAACLAVAVSGPWIQVAVIGATAIAGLVLIRPETEHAHDPLPMPVSHRAGLVALALFAILMAGLPLLARHADAGGLPMFDAFFRAGALVFGGGHVVLPLLDAAVIPSGWVSRDAFLAGYGVVQAMPGPLFTFAAFLGAAMHIEPSGWAGGLLCLVAIFLPGMLLLIGVLPFWESLRRSRRARAALAGVNAGVVGLLLAALYQPVWTSAVHAPLDFGLAVVALVALMSWRLPPWLVVAVAGGAGWLAGL